MHLSGVVASMYLIYSKTDIGRLKNNYDSPEDDIKAVCQYQLQNKASMNMEGNVPLNIKVIEIGSHRSFQYSCNNFNG